MQPTLRVPPIHAAVHRVVSRMLSHNSEGEARRGARQRTLVVSAGRSGLVVCQII